MSLSHAELLELVEYDPLTGLFKRRANGKITNGIGKKGYVEIRIKGILYYGHRLAWFYMKGEWPMDAAGKPIRVDHENLIKSDNIWLNLRLVTNAENAMNTGLMSTNTSGYKGVSFHSVVGMYRATIKHEGQLIHIGYRSGARDAALIYDEAALQRFGEFAKTNKSLGLL